MADGFFGDALLLPADASADMQMMKDGHRCVKRFVHTFGVVHERRATGAADRLARTGCQQRTHACHLTLSWTLADVADILNVSWRQVYALVRRKEVARDQIGGRGQWRVETAELERFIAEKKYDGGLCRHDPRRAQVDAVAGRLRRARSGEVLDQAERLLGAVRHHRTGSQCDLMHGPHGRGAPRFTHGVLGQFDEVGSDPA